MVMINTADGGDGIAYHWMKQEHAYSCAAASLCMILWMKQGKFLQEHQACMLLQAEHAKCQGEGAALAQVPVDWATQGVEPLVFYNATYSAISKAKGSKGTNTEYGGNLAKKNEAAKILRTLGPKTPAIAAIKRSDGWHAIVLANMVNDNLIVLDPASGIDIVKSKDWETGKYVPVRQSDEACGEINFCVLFPD